MLSPTLTDSGVTPSELSVHRTLFGETSQQTFLKETIDENEVNRGGCRSSGFVSHIFGCGIGAGNPYAGLEQRR